MTSLSDLGIKEALYAKLTTILEDSSLWDGDAFNVYDALDIENMPTEPTWPFVFVATRNLRQPPEYRPFIGIDIEVDEQEFQLGSTSYLARMTLSIIGSYEGQVSVIAGVIKRNFGTFVSGSDTFSQQYSGNKLWSETAITPNEPQFREGTLNQWLAISSAFAIL